MDEFKKTLLAYGAASVAYGECTADPDCRYSRVLKYEKAADEAFEKLMWMYQRALMEGDAR